MANVLQAAKKNAKKSVIVGMTTLAVVAAMVSFGGSETSAPKMADRPEHRQADYAQGFTETPEPMTRPVRRPADLMVEYLRPAHRADLSGQQEMQIVIDVLVASVVEPE